MLNFYSITVPHNQGAIDSLRVLNQRAKNLGLGGQKKGLVGSDAFINCCYASTFLEVRINVREYILVKYRTWEVQMRQI